MADLARELAGDKKRLEEKILKLSEENKMISKELDAQNLFNKDLGDKLEKKVEERRQFELGFNKLLRIFEAVCYLVRFLSFLSFLCFSTTFPS